MTRLGFCRGLRAGKVEPGRVSVHNAAVTAEFLQSGLLARAGFRHAFFTRRGGHSSEPFDSLHFGANGNDARSLADNVRAAADALAVDPARLYLVTQTHGREVAALSGYEDRTAVLAREADVLLTGARGVACGVKVADCVPILVGDRRSGAALAIHSGWQGTAADVVGAGIAAIRREVGPDADLVAAIGPHIEACCFEVGDDVAAKLEACAPGAGAVERTHGPRPHVDLRKIVRAQLVLAGLSDDAIDDVTGCTRCDGARFFSYRRDRERSGRMLSAIVARGSAKGA
jgi:YfiH family protein